jgi:hypothetical protein
VITVSLRAIIHSLTDHRAVSGIGAGHRDRGERQFGTVRVALTRYSYLLKQDRKIASPKDHSLYPDHLTDDMEQDHVTTDDSQACVFTYLWPKLIEQRILADKTKLLADLTNEADGAHRIVLRNVVGNGLEIALDET